MQRPSKVEEVMEDVFAASGGGESIAELADRLGVSVATISGARRLLVASGRMPKGKPGRRKGRKYPQAEKPTPPLVSGVDLGAIGGDETAEVEVSAVGAVSEVPTIEVTIESDPEYIPPSEPEIDRGLEELQAGEVEAVEVAEPTSADYVATADDWNGEDSVGISYSPEVEAAPI